MKIRPALKRIIQLKFGGETLPPKTGDLDCALGRNSFGTSPKVVEFARHYDEWANLWLHPDTSYKELKQDICKYWAPYADLETANIKIANGSAVVISRLNKLFIEPRVKVLGFIPQFTRYMLEVMVLGGKYEPVLLDPLNDYKFNPEDILKRITEDYRIIYIDNPNNPTGQLISLDHIEDIVHKAKTFDVTVIVDEAYGDYIEEKYSAVNLVNKYSNIIVTRTFTKGFGVGQLRVGYAILHAGLSTYYDKIALPFSVADIGSALVREALHDRNFILNIRQKVKTEKAKLTRGLKKRGYIIAETNEYCPIFIMRHREREIDLCQYLQRKGILTQPGNDWQNLDNNYVRINISPRTNEFLSKLDRP